MNEIVDITTITEGDNVHTFSLSPKQLAFLKAYAISGVIAHAAEVAEITYRCAMYWLKIPEFAELASAAYEQALDRAEREAWHRALEGDTETLYNAKGEIIGTRCKKSDVLLIFMLKGGRPHKYRDNINVSTDSQAQAIANELGVSQDEVKKAMAEGRQMLALK